MTAGEGEGVGGEGAAGVLVIGAGPTGLLLAAELELAGVSVTLVDQATERSGQSRALALQPRSVEILNSRGLRGLELSALSNWYGAEVVLREIRWATRFSDAARQADRYRVGRVSQGRSAGGVAVGNG